MSAIKKKNGSRYFGVLLILGGLGWILDEAGYGYYISGSFGGWVFFAFGLFLLISGYTQNSKRMAFWGTMITLVAGINLLQDYRIIHPYLIDVWPLYVSAIGVAFIVTIFIKTTDYAALIPGSIFLLSGAYVFMEVNGYFHYDFMYNNNRVLAIFLILIGSLLLWRNPRNKIEKKTEIVPTEESTESGKSNI